MVVTGKPYFGSTNNPERVVKENLTASFADVHIVPYDSTYRFIDSASGTGGPGTALFLTVPKGKKLYIIHMNLTGNSVLGTTTTTGIGVGTLAGGVADFILACRFTGSTNQHIDVSANFATPLVLREGETLVFDNGAAATTFAASVVGYMIPDNFF